MLTFVVTNKRASHMACSEHLRVFPVYWTRTWTWT